MSGESSRPNNRRQDEKIKCVVWDLDNALWLGTLVDGDDVVLASGAMDVIQELDRRGILQSIASKNEHDLAWSHLSAFGLAEYFLYPQIHWGSKSQSVKTIADRLGIAPNAIAFVDDQEFERDEVRHLLPEVTTIAAENSGEIPIMDIMQPTFVTNESRMRRSMYQAEASR